MPNVERHVVKPANETGRAGARAKNGFLPLSGEPPATHPSNEPGARGDRRGGSADLTPLASPVRVPDHRFNVENAKMPQPSSAIEPGKGAVPVNPPVASTGRASRINSVADMAKSKP
jgi:hypothetical protein